jgi:hypothetical protein
MVGKLSVKQKKRKTTHIGNLKTAQLSIKFLARLVFYKKRGESEKWQQQFNGVKQSLKWCTASTTSKPLSKSSKEIVATKPPRSTAHKRPPWQRMVESVLFVAKRRRKCAASAAALHTALGSAK